MMLEEEEPDDFAELFTSKYWKYAYELHLKLSCVAIKLLKLIILHVIIFVFYAYVYRELYIWKN